ncbi:MAG: hypothetical protein HKN45_01835, partial [Flavobacteriales bacterium]|nr:hypothetical protein [Flavobacteriales bacterium]
MKRYVFDVEGNGIDPTKLHCLSYGYKGEDGEFIIESVADYDDMRKMLLEADVLVGHNIIRWDVPVVERLLGISISARLIDTLTISWYIQPKRKNHRLEDYGEEFGIPKPSIDDWENLSLEEYIHRCEEDVKITRDLFNQQYQQLTEIYHPGSSISTFIDYLSFKTTCAYMQEKSRWKLDRERCAEGLAKLEKEKEEKEWELRKTMPPDPIKRKMHFPKKPYKKDGTLSAIGVAWFTLLHELNLPE